MSLRGIHILFVSAATLLAVFFGLWAFQYYLAHQQTGYLFTAMLSWLAAGALIIYGVKFSNKTKAHNE